MNICKVYMNKKLFIYNIILILFVLICSVCLIVMKNSRNDCVEAVIYVNGKVYMNINLDETDYKEFIIENEYGMNKILVLNGKICVSESDCPDKICIATGYTSSASKPVICMPHRLEIVIKNSDLDGVA